MWNVCPSAFTRLVQQKRRMGQTHQYGLSGVLCYEYSSLLLKRDKIKVGTLPEGKVTIGISREADNDTSN